MRIVHHLENSRSLRVLWMLEELGLDYELRRYPRDPKTLLAPPELRNVHPLGKSPVLQDGELVLAESGAILDYLADRYDTQRQLSPSPMPADGAERIAYRYWLHYAEGSAMPPLLLTLVMGRIRNAPMPFFARPIARSIADKAERGFIGPQRRLHLDSLHTLLALDGDEGNLLAFLQGLEAGALDGTEVHKQVRAAFRGDEAEALGVVEPLDGAGLTIRHLTNS